VDPIRDNSQQQAEESIDFKTLFFKLYSYWYFFLITIFIALLIAFLFNKYTLPVYKVKTTVLIKDDKSRMDPQALLGISLMSSTKTSRMR
jgi:tyrosine-protein kinase Etk/Wzc